MEANSRTSTLSAGDCMRLADVIESSLRAAKTPPQLVAKALSLVEDVEKTYGITRVSDLIKLPEWQLWLIVVKSLLSPLTKVMRREGFCKANYFMLGALVSLDERVANLVRTWVKDRCKAGNDPCCSSPKCCGMV